MSSQNHLFVRSDLALELAAPLLQEKKLPEGLSVHTRRHGMVEITCVTIETPSMAKQMGKPRGKYITIQTPPLWNSLLDPQDEIQAAAETIRSLLPSHGSILVVGLGNQEVTPDSLGPRALDNLRITRHLKEASVSISGIVPGVMAQTGMETAQIIHGIVEETGPEAVLVVDALAARSVSRLGNTIQLSSTGIQPGSGVGNHRHSLTEESLGVPVIALGVPTVVAAAAIVYDTLDGLSELLEAAGAASQADAVEGMTLEERYQMVKELIEPRLGPMFVTPGNIDEQVKLLSFIISEGINMAFEE